MHLYPNNSDTVLERNQIEIHISLQPWAVLVQIMNVRPTGGKPLSEKMVAQFTDAINAPFSLDDLTN